MTNGLYGPYIRIKLVQIRTVRGEGLNIRMVKSGESPVTIWILCVSHNDAYYRPSFIAETADSVIDLQASFINWLKAHSWCVLSLNQAWTTN